MIRTTLIDESSNCRFGSDELVAAWHEDEKSILWVDIQYEEFDFVASKLKEFNIHPLAIEDALRTRHPPKIEFFDEQFFILYRGIKSINGSLDFDHQQLALFVEKNILITVHLSQSLGIDKTIESLSKLKNKTPMHLALKIMKNASSYYLDNVLEFESRLSDLEDELQIKGNDKLITELTFYKSKLIKLIRGFKYHRTITQSLLTEADQYTYIDYEAHLHSINDLNERFDRLTTLSQMHYDIAGDLIDGYLSISAHQLNVTMRLLTVITAIFVPLSFLAGLYGMNFDYIPELKVRMGYFILLGVMAVIATSLLVFFKKNRWL
ncbi:MAG: magnesium transporter [Oleiphilaceae bacterium]|jgi:magnesium transporter